MSPKRSSFKWAISDYSKFYYTGQGTNAVTTVSSAKTVTVTTTPIREGQYLFFIFTDNGVPVNYIVSQAVSSGLTASFVDLVGDVGAGSGAYSVGLWVTDAIFNVPPSEFVIDASSTWSSANNTLSVTTSVALGDIAVILATNDSTNDPSNLFVVELLGSGTTNVSYRVIAGTEVALADCAGYQVFTFTSKYNVCSLEGIDVKECLSIEDSQNGKWIKATSFEQFQNAKNDYQLDGSILYWFQDDNQLFVYRGITSTDGKFIRAPIINYLTEKIATPTNE